jgi:copper amine oxidase domain protein
MKIIKSGKIVLSCIAVAILMGCSDANSSSSEKQDGDFKIPDLADQPHITGSMCDSFYDEAFKKAMENKPTEIIEGGKFGFADSNGKVLIKPIYDEAWRFKDGTAKVRIANKFGLVGINLSGSLIQILDPQYEYIGDFKGGFAEIKKEGGWTGIVNRCGEIIIKPEYGRILREKNGMFLLNQIKKYDNGVLSLRVNRYGLADKNGKILLEPNYHEIKIIDDKYIKIGVKQKEDNAMSSIRYGIANIDGTVIISPQYSEIMRKDNFFSAEQNSKYGALNLNGDTIVPFVYDNIFEAPQVIFAGKQGEFTMFSKDGKKIKDLDVKPDFTLVGNTYVGIRDQNNKYGLMDTQGNIIVEPMYQYITFFDNNQDVLETVTNDRKKGLINKNGEIILEPIYDEIEESMNNKNEYIVIRSEDYKRYYGIYNKSGRVVLEPKYTDYESIIFGDKRIFIVHIGERTNMREYKMGVLGDNSDTILNLEYNDISKVIDNQGQIIALRTKKDRIESIVDLNGNIIIEPKYSSIEVVKSVNDIFYLAYDSEIKMQKVFDKEGKIIIDAKYDFIEPAKMQNDDVFVVGNRGRKGLIGSDGKVILELIYNQVVVGDESIRVLDDTRWFNVDKTGNEIR